MQKQLPPIAHKKRSLIKKNKSRLVAYKKHRYLDHQALNKKNQKNPPPRHAAALYRQSVNTNNNSLAMS